MKKIITIFSLLLLSNLIFIIAQENSLEDSFCPEGCGPINPDGEIINCNNFYWVENYIKTQMNSSDVSEDMSNFVNLLKTANYNLQDEINQLELENRNYKHSFYGSFGFGILLMFYIYFRVRKIENRVTSSTRYKPTK